MISSGGSVSVLKSVSGFRKTGILFSEDLPEVMSGLKWV